MIETGLVNERRREVYPARAFLAPVGSFLQGCPAISDAAFRDAALPALSRHA
jgi:hypothetical protein